jgi:hypothetical protein
LDRGRRELVGLLPALVLGLLEPGVLGEFGERAELFHDLVHRGLR